MNQLNSIPQLLGGDEHPAHLDVAQHRPFRQAKGSMLSDVQMRRMFISAEELRNRIELVHGPMSPAEIATNGPARSYRLPGALGTIGFISQITSDLCANCNRIRLT